MADTQILLFVLNIVVLVIISLIGIILRGVQSTLNDINKSYAKLDGYYVELKQELNNYKTYVAEYYLKETSLKEVRKEILDRIQKLDDDIRGLNQKQDS